MVIKENMNTQQIRALEAMAEVGIPADKLSYCHATAKTVVDGVVRTMVFPKYFLNIERKEKDIEQLFSGKITPSRSEFLKRFPDATIISTNRGREDEFKHGVDKEYFDIMSRAKFVLCPNGEGIDRTRLCPNGDPYFSWTYRPFDAMFFRAIPIMEEKLELYKDYHYYLPGDDYVYRDDWVEENLEKAKKELML